MAMEMDTVMLLLAQVNRTIETRQDKRPQLNDLCESGNSEQDAEAVAPLNRVAYYGEETDFRRQFEFIIRKAQDGMIPLKFNEEIVSFGD
jgi:replicative DNA helicase